VRIRDADLRRQYQRDFCERRRAWLHDQKRDKPCRDCGGVFHPVAMSFHHRDPSTKEFTIGSKISNRTISALLAEIAKCDLLCANCHMIEEYA
jgi:hypothetical protein